MIDVRTFDLRMEVESFDLGSAFRLDAAIAVPPANPLLLPAVGAVSIPLGKPRIVASGFTFPNPVVTAIPAPAIERKSFAAAADLLSGESVAAPKRTTRVQPPSDLVKLEDRLFFLLQPPLETLLAQGALHFPFEPFSYQLDGVAFFYPRHHAVLADEMGLGKTMQAITSIRLLLHAGEIRRVLLICPKPLVTNWQRELSVWAPELPVVSVEGDQVRRGFIWTQPAGVVTLANYEIVVRDRDLITESGVNFDLVVLDEAQRIKNASGATAEVVRSIRRQRSRALTGTPVENSPQDLIGIFEFLAPGLLRKDMKPRAIGKAVSDYVLRRTKDKVLTELPPKINRDAHVELTPEQHQVYRQAEDEGIVQLSAMGESLTIQHVFQLVLRLKQICNFDPVTGASSKLEELYSDLEECAASGRKAIVFSQWVETLLRLKKHLAPFGPLEYHGRIPSKQRDGVIEEFRRDKLRQVLLMSYGAGSVGLNLQFAGYVFLFDRWWNPAVEDQAINRAHRIGAAGPVTVTRFLAKGTIEERIDQILQEKRQLFDAIFSETEPQANLGLSHNEIFGLFDLRTPKGRLKAA